MCYAKSSSKLILQDVSCRRPSLQPADWTTEHHADKFDVVAKTGQSLIASSTFQNLPEPPESTEMEVDPAPSLLSVPAVSSKLADGSSITPSRAATPAKLDGSGTPMQVDGKPDGAISGVATPSAKTTVVKKYAPPVDSSGDLLVECTVYIRLLLILANIDAKNLDEVSSKPYIWLLLVMSCKG